MIMRKGGFLNDYEERWVLNEYEEILGFYMIRRNVGF